jgi:hydroxymethylpyrimidine/phosphomethylpyrimidine kinase
MTAIAVTIAGSDSGGGAGIQADLKTFSALGVYGASIIAALTAQNTLGVTGIHDVPAAFVTAQIDAVFSDLDVGAVKIGMLSQPDVIRAVASGLDTYGQQKVVLDPVMVATSGDMLLREEAVSVLVSELLARAALVTPNMREAARLVEGPVAASETEMLAQAEAILGLGARAVLLKGGHGEGPESADLLLSPSIRRWYRSPRIATRNTHGTGCTLSSAIAAGLALGQDLETAVETGKRYVSEAIAAADRLSIGRGHGPVHHFHRWW